MINLTVFLTHPFSLSFLPGNWVLMRAVGKFRVNWLCICLYIVNYLSHQKRCFHGVLYKSVFNSCQLWFRLVLLRSILVCCVSQTGFLETAIYSEWVLSWDHFSVKLLVCNKTWLLSFALDVLLELFKFPESFVRTYCFFFSKGTIKNYSNFYVLVFLF